MMNYSGNALTVMEVAKLLMVFMTTEVATPAATSVITLIYPIQKVSHQPLCKIFSFFPLCTHFVFIFILIFYILIYNILDPFFTFIFH